MITTLTALLASKYGKYVLEIAIVAGLVFGAYKWAERRGRDAQKESDAQQQAQEIEKSRQASEKATEAMVNQAKASEAAADARAQAAQQQFASLAALLQGLAAKEQAGKEQVSKLADSELHGDIVHKLGVRPAGDSTACYLPAEERAIDDAVTQYPLCQQDKTALSGQVDAKGKEIQAANDVAAARQQAVDAQQKYIAQLEDDYKRLWELHPPLYRSGKCVWLWKCGKRQTAIKLPAP